MRIHHLDCGTMCPLGARWLGLDREIPCYCLLIETSEGLVLVDTGYGLADLADAPQRLGRIFCSIVRPKRDPALTAIRQIEALGFSRDDVRHILLTHLDHDHAGGLPDFPQAQVHVLQTELDAARHPRSWIDKSRYAPAQWSHGPNWVPHALTGEAWFDFLCVQPALPSNPDLLLVPIAGHSTGHCGIAVRRGDGWLLHVGDALFHHWELDPARGRPPLALAACQWLFQKNGRLVRENRERLKALAQSPNARVEVVCSHDKSQMPVGPLPLQTPVV